MELKAHFSDIHRVITGHLATAEIQICAAIAWFTDPDIFDVLCKKAGSGTEISIALIGDEINLGPGGLNFGRLQAAGGRVTFLPAGGRGDSMMHHKFCVIDRAKVITGSYNWSRKARKNDENITVVTDAEQFAASYLEAFDVLLNKVGQTPPASAGLGHDSIRRRLELIRSLVLLGEADAIAPHINKLREAVSQPGLLNLIAALDAGQYQSALEMIDEHLHRATALIAVGDVEVSSLRFDLFVLEIRLESLSDEKAELERRLTAFNQRHGESLGDLIKRLLRAQAELSRIAAEQMKQEGAAKESAEADASAAEADYAEYSRHHEELQKEVPLPTLDEDVERELKVLYRKACSLCHPQ